MKTVPASLLTIALAILPAGCNSDDKSKSHVVRIRPVLSTVAEAQAQTQTAFAGIIEPRFSTTLAFRVVGRVIARNVNVGDSVKKGAHLAALDPVPYDLAIKNARAALTDANAQLDNVTAEEARLRTLLAENHAPPQQYEAVQQAREAAQAGVTQAQSALEKALEQRSYADLIAEFDGVVTAVNTEVNQVVTPGQPVVVLARPDVREAVIDLPDDAMADLKEGSPFTVAPQIAPSRRIVGRVREIAPRVDPLTRSRRIRIALDAPSLDFRLGTMVKAYTESPPTRLIQLPASALLERGGKPGVWIVDPQSKSVSLRDVVVADRSDSLITVSAGISIGDRVIIAGVNSLDQGQVVRISEEIAK